MTAAEYSRDIPDEDHVATIMAKTGATEIVARFILAIERGDLDGDLEELD